MADARARGASPASAPSVRATATDRGDRRSPRRPPEGFRWQRLRHEIARAEGPERIAAEWWHRRDGRGVTRDYYRLEDTAGRRFWVFRHGLYGVETTSPRWYLHGIFA